MKHVVPSVLLDTAIEKTGVPVETGDYVYDTRDRGCLALLTNRTPADLAKVMAVLARDYAALMEAAGHDGEIVFQEFVEDVRYAEPDYSQYTHVLYFPRYTSD